MCNTDEDRRILTWNIDDLSILPQDVLALIINYLDIIDVRVLTRTSRKYRYLVKHLLRTFNDSDVANYINLNAVKTWYGSEGLPKKLSFNNIKIAATIDELIEHIPYFHNAHFINPKLGEDELKADEIIAAYIKYLDNYPNGDILISIASGGINDVMRLQISYVRGILSINVEQLFNWRGVYDLVMRAREIYVTLYHKLILDESFNTVELISKVKTSDIFAVKDLNDRASKFGIILSLDRVRIFFHTNLISIKYCLCGGYLGDETGMDADQLVWKNIRISGIDHKFEGHTEKDIIDELVIAVLSFDMIFKSLPAMKLYMRINKDIVDNGIINWIKEHGWGNNIILVPVANR